MMAGMTEELRSATAHNGWRIGAIRKLFGESVRVEGIAFTLDGTMGVFVDRGTNERFRVTVETLRPQNATQNTTQKEPKQ